MKSNSTVIGVVVCIVCCFCALCIIPHITTSENDLAGWNPSSVYDGVISPDNSNFTEAVLEENHGGGMAAAPRVSSTGSRMFHHSSASTMSAQGMGMGSSYAGASVHTTSSAAMSGTGSSISPISTSTASGSKAGSSMGGGAIYATSTSVSPRSSSASGSSLISSSALSAPTASRAAAPMMSASSAATSGNPAAMYASNMSSNYGTASYGGYSGPKGVRGRQGVAGWGNIGSTIWEAWLTYVAENGKQGWLYDGDGWEDGDGKLSFFDLEKLRSEFDNFDDWLANISGITNLPPGYDPTWADFMNWWNNQSNNEDDWYDGKNVYFRTPLPDGVGVLLVLSLLCVLFTFLRSRDKKILEESNNQ